jgi:serine/threonine protein kinase/Tol biopolymer transport system component
MQLTPGTRLGPYEILAFLDKGGMGEVYRARDPRLQRDVAIKVISGSFSQDHDRLKRFEHEARAASRLNHPNVLAIFDLGSYEGAPFVVSELLEGRTLRARLEADSLPFKRALDYAIQIANGLAAAHEKGVVHRDLKPENLFITRDDRIKILDFGLAKLRSSSPGIASDATTVSVSFTDSGVVLGTVGYMAPEQVRGEPADLRCDIFAFGCVLYEMLSSRRAFQGPSPVEIMAAILSNDPPALSQIRPDLPAALDPIVHHCLEKAPDKRFQSAQDVGFALSLLTTPPGSPLSRVDVSRPRSRLTLTLALGGLFILGAIAAYRLGAFTHPGEQASFQRLSFRRGYVTEARFAPDGHTIVYSAAFDGGPVRIFSTRIESPESGPLDLPTADLLSISSSGTMAVILRPELLPPMANYRGTLAEASLAGGAAREVLEDVTWADWAPNGSDLAAVRIGNGDLLEFPLGHPAYHPRGWLSHPRVSPDGRRVGFIEHQTASGEDAGSVMLLDADGKVRTLTGSWQSIQGLAWSASGREVWFSASKAGNARDLWGVSPSGRVRLILRMAGGLTLHDISRDGRVLLARESFRDGILALLPGESRERDLSWLDWSDIADLSPDGRTMLFTELGEGVGANYAVCLRGTDGSPVLRLGNGFATAISPDGNWVTAIVKSPSQHLVLLPTHAGEARSLPPGPLRVFTWSTWFADGRRIVINASDGQPSRAWVQDVRGGEPRPITRPGVTADRVTPDGRYVMAGDSLVPIDGGSSIPLRGYQAGDLFIRFDPSGQKFYAWRFGQLPSKIYRIDMASGRRETWKEFAPADLSGIVGIGPVQISADGRTCAYTYGRLLSDLYMVSGLR